MRAPLFGFAQAVVLSLVFQRARGTTGAEKP